MNDGLNTSAYGQKLSQARYALGLSQTAAGQQLGKARETLSMVERGLFRYAPSPREMQQYEALYGIPQLEQLSTLGYNVEALRLDGPGVLTAAELELLNMFRSLKPAMRLRTLRLLVALGPPQSPSSSVQ